MFKRYTKSSKRRNLQDYQNICVSNNFNSKVFINFQVTLFEMKKYTLTENVLNRDGVCFLTRIKPVACVLTCVRATACFKWLRQESNPAKPRK